MKVDPDIIEKYCNVNISEGGFSFHGDYIGMNIHEKNGVERDFFINIQEYLRLEKIEILREQQ